MTALSEAEKRKAVAEKFKQDAAKKAQLEIMRKYARHFVYANKGYPRYQISNVVTSDDIREHFGTRKEDRIPGYKGVNNVNGSIFLDEGWVPVGHVKSRSEGRKGSLITLWTRAEYAQSVKMQIHQQEMSAMVAE